jgi:protein-tyrosine phosphatase
MAEFVMKDIVKKNGMEKDFVIRSSATSTEEIGSDTHWGTKQVLDEMGIPYTKRQAVQLKKSDYENYDFIIGMDSANMRNINRIVGYDKDDKIHKLLSFAHMDRDVADPWYTRDFRTTYNDVNLGCNKLFDYIMSKKTMDVK